MGGLDGHWDIGWVWQPHSWLTYYVRMTILTLLASSVIGVFGFGFVCPKCGVSLDEPTRATPSGSGARL
jgi:hypothetical protein